MTHSTNIIATIEQHISDMTEVEMQIADYFIEQALSATDLSSQKVATELHVSLAALTRFAKKCGFKGYREFVFACLHARESVDKSFNSDYGKKTKRVLLDYEDISRQTQQLINEEQLKRIAELVEDSERVYFFGKGSSGVVAREMKLRLMRLGVICEALTDQESFSWTISILDKRCLVIGFSLSGQTSSVLTSLEAAKLKGAKTILFSTKAAEYQTSFDETVELASLHQLDYGNRISPQFPMLILLDIMYAYFLDINREKKEAIFSAYHFPPRND